MKISHLAAILLVAGLPVGLQAQDLPPAPGGLAPEIADEGDGDLAGNPFAASDYPDAMRYRACLAEVRNDPRVALEAAALWRDHEGGVPAKHCTAAALLALDRPEEAAAWLDEAAGDVAEGQGLDARGASGGKLLVAELKAQAGNAWMIAGNYEKAHAAFTEAIARLPLNVPALADLLIDRARAAAGLGQFDRAVSDLSRVIDQLPPRDPAALADLHVLRATAQRYLQSLDEAELDLARALALDPDNGEALFERGVVRRIAGDDAGAREDWERVAELYPGSDTAELALDNLELMRAD